MAATTAIERRTWLKVAILAPVSAWLADTGPVLDTGFAATLAKAQGGDQAAFAVIFRDVQPVLLRYLGVIAPDAADVAAGGSG